MSIRSTTVTVPVPQTGYLPMTTPDWNALEKGWISIVLMSLTVGAEVWASFGGVNDHCHLVSGSPATGFKTDQVYDKIWLRGAGIAAVVQLVMESSDI